VPFPAVAEFIKFLYLMVCFVGCSANVVHDVACVAMTPLPCVARQRPGCGQSRRAERAPDQSRDKRDVTRASTLPVGRRPVSAVSGLRQRRPEPPTVLRPGYQLHRSASD